MSGSYSIQSPLDLRLPQNPETNDPILLTELTKVYNALRQIQLFATEQTEAIPRSEETWAELLPTDTIKVQNLNRVYVRAAEALNFGDMINFLDSGGILSARKADATNGSIKQCQGHCTQIGGIAAGAYGEVQVGSGLCLGVGGMVTGQVYYLSTTPGLISAGAPVAPHLRQPVGFALSPQLLYFMCPPV